MFTVFFFFIILSKCDLQSMSSHARRWHSKLVVARVKLCNPVCAVTRGVQMPCSFCFTVGWPFSFTICGHTQPLIIMTMTITLLYSSLRVYQSLLTHKFRIWVYIISILWLNCSIQFDWFAIRGAVNLVKNMFLQYFVIFHPQTKSSKLEIVLYYIKCVYIVYLCWIKGVMNWTE